MRTSDFEILERLHDSIHRGDLEIAFPEGLKSTRRAYQLGLMTTTRPFRNLDFGNFEKSKILEAIDAWSMKSLKQFITWEGDQIPRIVYDHLLGMVDSTAELGAQAVVYLVKEEEDLSRNYGYKPREELVAHFIETYTGRINILPDLANTLKENFPESSRIDIALAKQVVVHQLGERTKDDIFRNSDFLSVVSAYPKTLRAHLQCLKSHGSDMIYQYLDDGDIHGLKPDMLEAYIDCLGYEAMAERSRGIVIASCRSGFSNPALTFHTLLERFGDEIFTDNGALLQEIRRLNEGAPPSEFTKWYIKEMPVAVDSLIEMLLPAAPILISKYKVIPKNEFIHEWRKNLDAATFVHSVLGSLGSLRGEIDASDDPGFHGTGDIERAIEFSFDPSNKNNEESRCVRYALDLVAFEDIKSLVKKIPYETLCQWADTLPSSQRQDFLKVFPQASSHVIGIDLGI